MRATLILDDALFRELKKRVAQERRTLTVVVDTHVLAYAANRDSPEHGAAAQARDFLAPVLDSELVILLRPTARHREVLRETIQAYGKPAGNIFHDLHTAVLMREHGVGEIMTSDTDFRKFTFLTVTDPVHVAP